MLDPLTTTALFFIAMAGAALNALSGGGTFIVFPSLLLAGIAPVIANTTTTVALWPGVASSALAYRGQLESQPRLPALAAVSFVGGALGALLLLWTPSKIFEALVPYLLLFATATFTVGPSLTRRLGFSEAVFTGKQTTSQTVAILGTQFVIALYGGYFGGGIGILMLAAFSFFGMKDFHSTNALRTILAASINSIAVIAFVIAGAVAWPVAGFMVVGAIIGGYGGVRVFRRVPGAALRRVVITIATLMTLYFFLRAT